MGNKVYPRKLKGWNTVYPKKYAHGFWFAVLCSGYTLTDFPISIRLTSLALWQSNDCPSASKATLMNMDEYFMWIDYERLHNHNKAKHNKTVCIFLGIYCMDYVNRRWIITPQWKSLDVVTCPCYNQIYVFLKRRGDVLFMLGKGKPLPDYINITAWWLRRNGSECTGANLEITVQSHSICI